MSHRPLARPVTTTEQYLAAILVELRKLNGEPPDTPETAVIDIREPKPVGTPIPDGFPGRDALLDAGIATVEKVPKDGGELIKIKGIGRITAGQILTELS